MYDQNIISKELYDEMDEAVQKRIDDKLVELDFYEKEIKKIKNLDNLGNVLKRIIWEQFLNQVAATAGKDFIKENKFKLNLLNDAHIQTTKNFKKGKFADHNNKINYEKRYNNWIDNFQKDENGKIKKNHQGESILNKNARSEYDKLRPQGSASMHKDHIIPVAEIIKDDEAATHLNSSEKRDFANSNYNIQDLDSSANMSKGDKTNTVWLDSEKNGKKPVERFNIDEKGLKENDERARDKWEEVKENGRKKSIETGKQSQKEEAFRITGKALRTFVITLLAKLARKIVNKLIKWFKSGKRNLDSLLLKIEDAIKEFLQNIKEHLIDASKAVFTTILTSIIGPVVSTIKKAWMLLKESWKTIKEAIDHINKPENKGKSIDILILEIGKIIMVGLSATGGVLLSEVIEKKLLIIPLFAIKIPLIGSLANIIGVFMGAAIAGIFGAIVINLIEKFIDKKRKIGNIDNSIDTGNQILNAQIEGIVINQKILTHTKEGSRDNIGKRHEGAVALIASIINDDCDEVNNNKNKVMELHSILDNM